MIVRNQERRIQIAEWLACSGGRQNISGLMSNRERENRLLGECHRTWWGCRDVVARESAAYDHGHRACRDLVRFRAFRERPFLRFAATLRLRLVGTGGDGATMAPLRKFTAGFMEPRIPTRAAKPPSGADRVHEIRRDGYRLIIHRGGDSVRLFTLTTRDWTDRYSAIARRVIRPVCARGCSRLMASDRLRRRWRRGVRRAPPS